jgi:protein HIRA/HIR1
MPVVDLAWCPDSTMLVSCSLDSDAVVWAADTGTVRAILQGHSSFVKGVAWDPIGSYVATFGEDRVVRLWATDSWTPVASIEKSLERLSLNTLCCRCASSCCPCRQRLHKLQTPALRA